MWIGASSLHSQNPNYYLPINFKDAYEAGTCAANGAPRNNYWQTRADYQIELSLQREPRLVSGKETIIYQNNSPGELWQIVFHLFPNLHKKPRGLILTSILRMPRMGWPLKN